MTDDAAVLCGARQTSAILDGFGPAVSEHASIHHQQYNASEDDATHDVPQDPTSSDSE